MIFAVKKGWFFFIRRWIASCKCCRKNAYLADEKSDNETESGILDSDEDYNTESEHCSSNSSEHDSTSESETSDDDHSNRRYLRKEDDEVKIFFEKDNKTR